jgi:predicted TIM-barrel fold metal-dependent hydrolase
VEIIDAHNHIWPEKIVYKAKNHLESIISKVIILPIADNLLRSMDDAGISKSVVSSVASRPDQVISINNWLFSLNQERFITFASIHPFFNGYKEELKRIKDNALGIKLQPEFQKFYIDDEKIFPLYEELEKLKIPALLHCGISSYGDASCSPDKVAKVLEKFPGIKIIGAHMGGFLMWEEAFEKLAGRNLYLDTSDSIKRMKKDLIDKFFEKHGFDKIIYGSDFPIADSKEEIESIKLLDISEENKQKIFALNIKKLLLLS